MFVSQRGDPILLVEFGDASDCGRCDDVQDDGGRVVDGRDVVGRRD